ncbi:hypothetical protein H696_01885 [Fonticula alba]|uniref:Uncharacterized protein n=1 Tax=Fonticula alba TaxID=691883 RepID=A0A058ZAD8_FONAL|nr:hypothetical protein, variant [Fonticula alba]XP_009494061.1 hypothetical protein H696_01885 [Fonticula alba]KCV70937.1 hypothetical protein H696_01885 [Fonticula alba]KCV70938.1 hypothetical protein, variant [Fonticula alba]|eukprot:XP_009494060.1 hypothetical protein, variant [Fonticula alba]
MSPHLAAKLADAGAAGPATPSAGGAPASKNQFRATIRDPLVTLAQIVALQCVFYVAFGLCVAVLALVYGSLLGPSHAGPWYTATPGATGAGPGGRALTAGLELAWLFDSRVMRFSSPLGWLVAFAQLAACALISITFPQIVERSKSCLDFVATMYIIHMVACFLFPASALGPPGTPLRGPPGQIILPGTSSGSSWASSSTTGQAGLGIGHTLFIFPISGLWWATALVGLVVCTLLAERLCIARELEPISFNSAADQHGSGSPV